MQPRWSRWNSTFQDTLRYGWPGSIPACGVSCGHAGRDGPRPSRLRCTMDGRVPSRPAVFHAAALVEMDLDLPGYAALWMAGFHPGLRCFMRPRWSRWNSTFQATLHYGWPGSIPVCGVSCGRAGRDGTRPSRLRCAMDGRVPSRPAVFHAAALVEMDLDRVAINLPGGQGARGIPLRQRIPQLLPQRLLQALSHLVDIYRLRHQLTELDHAQAAVTAGVDALERLHVHIDIQRQAME